MREYVTIVSGMPRRGMPLLTDERRPADLHNPRGYFEYEPVKHLAEDSSWVEAARGEP